MPYSQRPFRRSRWASPESRASRAGLAGRRPLTLPGTRCRRIGAALSLAVGPKAARWGRKPIFLAGFAVLPIRGVLYTLSQDPSFLVSIQILDGIGAGIFGVLFFIVVADLTKGTGRYNLVQGAASACWGLGAALSNSVAGFIVDRAGYDAAFLFLACCALAAFLLFWIGMPETSTTRVARPPAAGGPAPLWS